MIKPKKTKLITLTVLVSLLFSLGLGFFLKQKSQEVLAYGPYAPTAPPTESEQDKPKEKYAPTAPQVTKIEQAARPKYAPTAPQQTSKKTTNSSNKQAETRKWDTSKYLYVALTVDDGPSADNDARILSALSKVSGRATFFITGSMIPNNPETLNKILDQGSELGNHSYNHPQFTLLSPESMQAELQATSDLIYSYTQTRPSLVRLPYGAYNSHVLQNVPYPMIQWSIDTVDWRDRDAAIVADRIMSAPPGSIILIHSLHPTSAAAVEYALPIMYKQGYRFVTVSELFEIYGKNLKANSIYSAP